MVASSVVLTVLVLNYHHRTADNHEMQQWVIERLLISINEHTLQIHIYKHWVSPPTGICQLSNCNRWAFRTAGAFVHLYFQVKTVLLQWLPWLLGMHRPGKKITRKTIMMSNKMREIERHNKSSKSLIANVADMNDDYRCRTVPYGTISSTYGRYIYVPILIPKFMFQLFTTPRLHEIYTAAN